MPSLKKTLLDAIEKKKKRILKLTSDLVKFNTTSPNPGQQPVDDRQCQDYVARQLKQLGFKVDLWEPEMSKLRHYPFYIEGQNFKNRPMLAARLKGSGGGRSLILNAHLDVVPAGDMKWKHKPWSREVVGDKIYGRGSCDMKGGELISVILFSLILYSSFALPAFSGPVGPYATGFVVGIYVAGLVIYYIARAYRRRAGIDLDLLHKEVPPE